MSAKVKNYAFEGADILKKISECKTLDDVRETTELLEAFVEKYDDHRFGSIAVSWLLEKQLESVATAGDASGVTIRAMIDKIGEQLEL